MNDVSQSLAGRARPVLSILALALCTQMALHSAPAAAACGGVTPVANGIELDNAIAAFNSETTNNCVFTISVGNDIPVSFPLPIVSNNTAGAKLIIEGNGYKVDSQNRANQRVFNIAANTTVTLNELTVTGGSVSGSGVDNRGGGILSRGNLTLQESSVIGNASQNFGGGIATLGGTLTIRQSTIANNASGGGGGIHNEGGTSIITIENSTISGNDASAADSGAGIRLEGGELTLDSVTIYDNFPGGVYVGAGSIDVTNSIIAENGFNDCVFRTSPAGRINDGGHNLVYESPLTEGVYCGVEAGINGNINATASLDVLADNGGPTLTHAPLPGSPVVDAGATVLAKDQVGHPRPIGDADDIGAYEARACVGSEWSVSKREDWAIAVDCFNSQTAAGVYTIRFVQPFGTAESLATIDNDTSGVSLVIEGNGKYIEGFADSDLTIRLLDVAQGTEVEVRDLGFNTGNVAAGDGGGVVNNLGDLTLKRCVVESSRAAIGGGVVYNGNGGTLVIEDSALVQNGAFPSENDVAEGATILNLGSLSLRNSTVSGNREAGVNNSILVSGPDVEIDSVTIAENDSGNDPTVFMLFGGTINNSIIADNTGSGDLRCSTVPTGSHNIIGAQIGSCFTDGQFDNQVGADPLLGPLNSTTFGAPAAVRFHPLLAGSPAIDRGATDLTTDQRGFPRPDGPADDIGAYEATSTNGRLTIRKEATPANGTAFAFSLVGGSTTEDFQLASGETASFVLASGSYTVKEILPEPHPRESVLITCADANGPVGSVSGNTVTIDLQPSEDVECTFVNEVIPDDGVIKAVIDWKPGSNPSAINLRSRGTTPVAILGNSSFDVAMIDIASVRANDELFYAGPGVNRNGRGYQASYEDVNADGIMDLVVHFQTRGLRDVLSNGGDGTLYLSGDIDGQRFIARQQAGDPLKLIGL